VPYDPDRHHRRSIRLRDYDYSQAGAYFVTICVYNQEYLLGDVVDGEARLSEAGEIVAQMWDDLPSRFPTVELDAFVVMPNHVHGIIVIVERPASEPVGAGLALPSANTLNDHEKRGTPRGAPTVGDIVGAFKSLSAIACNRLLDRGGVPFWQRNYWEHIVRDERDLNRLRDYIAANPARWFEDEENPAKRYTS
jgi:putative transposase